MNNLFLLHCAVSAKVRQSATIHFNDLKLPSEVVDTLKERRAISIRPTLSLKLKEFLTNIRMQQRYLYDECCIHKGDIHFLHADFFQEAKTRIDLIRQMARQYNDELWELWAEEFETWTNSVTNVLEPIFEHDPEGFEIAKEAYLRLFPSREQFKDPIDVFVVGPNPVYMEEAQDVGDHPFAEEITKSATVNTREVFEAARGGAADRAMLKASELLDDLDARNAVTVSDRQTGTAKRRGTWEKTAQELILISTYCPDFKNLSLLAEKLLSVGKELSQGKQGLAIKQRSKILKRYEQVKGEIRKEMEVIVASKDSSEGYEALKKSLSLSNSYKDLMEQMKGAQSLEELEKLQATMQSEAQIFEHRARQLNKVYEKQTELIKASSVTLDEIIEEVKDLKVEGLEDVDF